MTHKNKAIIILFLLSVIVTNACKKSGSDPETVNEPYLLSHEGLPEPKLPEDNQLTKEGVKLGRMLFYENMLSRTNTQSCSSCHMQQFAFTDTATFSVGVRGLNGKRQAMSVFNMAWHTNEFFWDGRAHLLRDQSLKPIQDELEMDETLENVVAKLSTNADYRSQFDKAFGTENITPELISKALEQFMMTIISNSSKYDDFLAGKVTLTPEEERGRYLFFTEFNPGFPAISGADCQHCHSGANFENDLYMNNGLDTDADFSDVGRATVTGNAMDRAKFKVPSLRNVALTAPYMHDGRFKTLEEVVNHYNLVHASSTLDPAFLQQLPNGLQLTNADKAALVAFLNTLTDEKLISNPEYSSPF